MIITVTAINAIHSCGKIRSQSPVNNGYKLIKMPSVVYVCVAINCSQYTHKRHNCESTHWRRHGMMTDKSIGEEKSKFISNKLNWLFKNKHTYTHIRARGHSCEVSVMLTEICLHISSKKNHCSFEIMHGYGKGEIKKNNVSMCYMDLANLL